MRSVGGKYYLVVDGTGLVGRAAERPWEDPRKISMTRRCEDEQKLLMAEASLTFQNGTELAEDAAPLVS